MGYSFAAGTTDGPGAFNFKQGTITDNPLWNKVRDLLSKPSKEQIRCHGAKPILLNTGEVSDYQILLFSFTISFHADHNYSLNRQLFILFDTPFQND